MIRAINRAYWLIRCMIPVACMCYFVSYVRYVTEVEFVSFVLPSERLVLMKQFGVVGQYANKFRSV